MTARTAAFLIGFALLGGCAAGIPAAGDPARALDWIDRTHGTPRG